MVGADTEFDAAVRGLLPRAVEGAKADERVCLQVAWVHAWTPEVERGAGPLPPGVLSAPSLFQEVFAWADVNFASPVFDPGQRWASDSDIALLGAALGSAGASSELERWARGSAMGSIEPLSGRKFDAIGLGGVDVARSLASRRSGAASEGPRLDELARALLDQLEPASKELDWSAEREARVASRVGSVALPKALPGP